MRNPRLSAIASLVLLTAGVMVTLQGPLLALASPPPDSRGTVRAYVLIEVRPNQASWMDDHSGSIGLGACKGVYRSLWPNEAMLHLECQDLPAFDEATARSIPKLKGVTHYTVAVMKG